MSSRSAVAWLTRLLPDSLFGRLVVTFVCGVALTMLVTLLSQMPEREAFVFRISSEAAAHRLSDQLKLMDQLPAAGRRSLAEIAERNGTRVILPAEPLSIEAPEPGTNAAVFRDSMLDDLGRRWRIEVEVTPATLAPESAGGETRDAYAFDVRARLSDESWVGFSFSEPRRLPRWPRRLMQNMLIALGVLSVLSFFAMRWVTRPLHSLAQAAEDLGRDINRPPLPESGPREVRRAAHAFNAMQDRLSRYIRTRTGILTAMSHDLKTPITRLRLRAEMLEQPETREKFVRDLGEMQAMVDSTLGYMRGLDDREPLRAVDVRALAEALQADAEELGHPVRVLGEANQPFVGKPEGLKRCLQNLLDNALRYGADVELVVEDTATVLTLTVRDRGPGIPEDQLERVFEPFYRLEASRNSSTGGTGLGLAIARNIAQSMGGDVTLSNRSGGGLEAKMMLPRSGVNADVAQPLPAAGGKATTPAAPDSPSVSGQRSLG